MNAECSYQLDLITGHFCVVILFFRRPKTINLIESHVHKPNDSMKINQLINVVFRLNVFNIVANLKMIFYLNWLGLLCHLL